MGDAWSIRVCSKHFRETTLRALTLMPRDVLMEVISVSHFPPESNYTRSTLKRPRNPDISSMEPAIYSGSNDGGIAEQRPIAGSNRVSAALELGSRVGSPSASDLSSRFNLPLKSGQLGSLPVYEPFDWSTPQTQWISSKSLPVSVPNEYIDFSLISQSISLTSQPDLLTSFIGNPPLESANIQDSPK